MKITAFIIIFSVNNSFLVYLLILNKSFKTIFINNVLPELFTPCINKLV